MPESVTSYSNHSWDDNLVVHEPEDPMLPLHPNDGEGEEQEPIAMDVPPVEDEQAGQKEESGNAVSATSSNSAARVHADNMYILSACLRDNPLALLVTPEEPFEGQTVAPPTSGDHGNNVALASAETPVEGIAERTAGHRDNASLSPFGDVLHIPVTDITPSVPTSANNLMDMQPMPAPSSPGGEEAGMTIPSTPSAP